MIWKSNVILCNWEEVDGKAAAITQTFFSFPLAAISHPIFCQFKTHIASTVNEQNTIFIDTLIAIFICLQ